MKIVDWLKVKMGLADAGPTEAEIEWREKYQSALKGWESRQTEITALRDERDRLLIAKDVAETCQRVAEETLAACRKDLRTARETIVGLKLIQLSGEGQRMLKVLREQRVFQDAEIEAVLKLVGPENDVWRVVHQFLTAQIEEEVGNAIAPNIGNEGRHLNAGRAAGLKDFQAGLVAKWAGSRHYEAPSGGAQSGE